MNNFIKKISMGMIVITAFLAVLFITSPAKADSVNEAHPNGVLIRLNDKNQTVLLIQDGKGVGIPSPSVFHSHGFSFDKVVPKNEYDNFYVESVMQYADSDASLIIQISEKTLSELESDWSEWLDVVINTTESGEIDSILSSFVAEYKGAWDSWWAENSGYYSWINNLRIE